MSTTPFNSNTEERPFIEIDPDMVQVKASKAELERRIAAFTSRKRAHLDSSNRVEFCGSGGAARVAAVLGRSRGSKGHLRKTNADDVSNVLSDSSPSKQMKLTQSAATTAQVPIDRRFSELEERVFFREGEPVPLPIYQRLKELEDRVLELEGLSPDHCEPFEVVKKRDRDEAAAARKETRSKQLTSDLQNINSRIFELKNILRARIEGDS